MTGPSSLSRGVCIATALAVLAGMVLPLRLDLAATLGHSNRHTAPPVHSRLHLIKAVRMEQRMARPAKRVFRLTPSEWRFPTSAGSFERNPAAPRLMSALPPLRC